MIFAIRCASGPSWVSTNNVILTVPSFGFRHTSAAVRGVCAGFRKFQVAVGNILAMDADPNDTTSNNDKWDAWNTAFNNEFRKGLHNKQVVE